MRDYKEDLKNCDLRIAIIKEELSKCNLEITRLMKKENLKHLKKVAKTKK